MDDEHINNLRVFCEDVLKAKPKRIVFENMLIDLMIEKNKVNPEDEVLIGKIDKVIESIKMYLNVIDFFQMESV